MATARAMFGPGFVWLVQCRNTDGPEFRIMNTYLAGSPYPSAHYRSQPVDMNTQSQSSLGGGLTGEDFARQNRVQNSVGFISRHSTKEKLAPGGMNVIPLLCLNTWEHVYLMDWGFRKDEYAAAWWDMIDWGVVHRRVDDTGRPKRKRLYM